MRKFKKICFFFGKFLEVVFNLLFKNRELNTEVTICITSYKSRINQSFLTLLSLLGQSEKYQIYLFIAEDDKNFIGKKILWLEKKHDSLTIVFTEDVRSYKKLMPMIDLELIIDKHVADALSEDFNSSSHVMTADDDIFYSANTVECMTVHADKKTVVFNVGRRLDPLKKYYELDPFIPNSSQVVHGILPIGAGGILYSKYLLKYIGTHGYMRLAPTCDDIWFYSCLMEHADYAFNSEAAYFKLSKVIQQKESLLCINIKSNNDQALSDLVFSKKRTN